MTKTTEVAPSIFDLLAEFFASYRPNASAAVGGRIEAVRSDLEQHLEREGPRILSTGQLAILSTEKQFSREGAFARTMHADDLYYGLVLYLDPAHALQGIAERDTQLDVVAAIAEGLWRRRQISDQTVSECAIIEFEIAMSRGRDLVKTARRQARAPRSN